MLAGDCRVDDLSRLLRSLRGRVYGYQAIKDIADLTAHEDNRDQGEMVGAIAEIYYSVKLHLLTSEIADIRRVPADYRDALFGCFDRLSEIEIVRRIGHNKKSAQSRLNAAAIRFKTNVDGTLDLSGCDATDRDILQAMASFRVAPAYTTEGLFKDFVIVLQKNKFLHPDEAARFGPMKDKLAIFVLSLLHRMDASLPKGDVAELVCEMSAKDEGRLLAVVSSTRLQKSMPIHFATRIFQTHLPAWDHCAPELLAKAAYANGIPDNPASWSCSIEVGPDWKLRPMA